MKQILSLTIILLISVTAFSQSKKSGKVKRKYRDIEQIAQTQQPVFLRNRFMMKTRFREWCFSNHRWYS